jgi:hypothetical protein
MPFMLVLVVFGGWWCLGVVGVGVGVGWGVGWD